jgi:CheY-like chemotaxis protein
MRDRHLNIVIADDDSDDQLLTQQAIQELGLDFSVTSVYDGFQLMDYLLKRKDFAANTDALPDFILLDINMPLLNGFGALAQMKDNETLKHIPVYILSTSHSKADLTLSRQLGADGFYTKPIMFDQLKNILEEIVHFADVQH